MTVYSAKMLGVETKLGSLEVGKTAGLVLWAGTLIQMRSRVEK
jgi:imidazolonepropionase-like amidohydrolase